MTTWFNGQVSTAEHMSFKTRFAAAYDAQIQRWVDATKQGKIDGPSAWDGYLAAAAVEDGRYARAGALKLVGAGVQQLKTLAQQLFAGGAKNLADALVAVHDGAVARKHQAHGGHVKRQSVIDVHGAGWAGQGRVYEIGRAHV